MLPQRADRGGGGVLGGAAGAWFAVELKGRSLQGKALDGHAVGLLMPLELHRSHKW